MDTVRSAHVDGDGDRLTTIIMIFHIQVNYGTTTSNASRKGLMRMLLKMLL